MSTPLNVTLVISKFPPEYSGPGVRIPRFYDWLKDQNKPVNLNVICAGIEHTQNETYTHKGLSVRRITAHTLRRLLSFLPKRIFNSALYQIEFIQACIFLWVSGTLKYKDLIHIAGHSGLTAATILYANTHKIPVLMELVNEQARHIQKTFFIWNIRPHKNSIVIALTQKTKLACEEMGLSADNIWQRPNPYNTDIFKPEFSKRYELREALTPFTKEHIVISSVAKIMPRKNQKFLLDVLLHLPENFVCVIAGPLIEDGPLYARDKAYLDEMQSVINTYKLQNRVHIITDFVDADHYMKLSDIYAMPAWDEGFGTPMVEAMGCGIPVIANKDEHAFQEYIENGENGYLCDMNKPEDWAKALTQATQFSDAHCLNFAKKTRKDAGQNAIYERYSKIIASLTQRDF